MADFGCLSRPSISSALLCSDADWPRKLVVGPDLLFSHVCSKARLEDIVFKVGFQNWT
jgi:hypothetical protein